MYLKYDLQVYFVKVAEFFFLTAALETQKLGAKLNANTFCCQKPNAYRTSRNKLNTVLANCDFLHAYT